MSLDVKGGHKPTICDSGMQESGEDSSERSSCMGPAHVPVATNLLSGATLS